jgi:spore maturation protein CgeB
MGMKDLHVALIADQLTTCCLSAECKLSIITPRNYRWMLRFYKPDILLVESAWEGRKESWKYKIAAYPDHPERTNTELRKVVAYARDRGIPTVFWNKEDAVHFDRFISSASLFEHIFTVDENCISKYRSVVAREISVNKLMFPVQPKTHYFEGFKFRYNEANFVGSYTHNIHHRRREWQNLMFQACAEAGIPVSIYDRNSNRKSANYRYPQIAGLHVRPAIGHAGTAAVYRQYLVSLNVNTVEDSPSMYSRRLVEILACGGIAVTNPTPAVDRYFADYCHTVEDYAQAAELFARLKHGPSADDLERAEAGSRYVLATHTWANRLADVCRVVSV